MSYPHAVKTGNAVIAAALAWEEQRRAWYRSAPAAETGAMEAAARTLVVAVLAHREATALEHLQKPDMDADFPCPEPRT